MAKINLICGPVGAGKTTLAKKLSEREKAICFSIDEWMTTLFTPDLKKDMDYDWAMERIGRMESLIWSHVRQLMTQGVSVILDLGLLQKDHRRKFYNLAKAEGYDLCLHWVDVAREERWSRIEGRNAEKGATYAMEVSREMFDFCEGLFERPSEDELAFTVIHTS